MWLRRRHIIHNGHHTMLGVKRLSTRSWSWKVWRTHNGEIVMSGLAYSREQALSLGDTWRRIDARQHGRHPSDV